MPCNRALLIEAEERKKILEDSIDDLRKQLDAKSIHATDLKEKMTRLELEVSELRDHSEKLAGDMRDAQQVISDSARVQKEARLFRKEMNCKDDVTLQKKRNRG